MMNTPSADPGLANPRRDAVFFGVAALVFAIATTFTIHGCRSMSMPWMRMPDQTWLSVVAAFLGMWIAMMVAMMLPALMPVLWRYRQALGRAGAPGRGWLTALVGVGYFCVWSAFGVTVFPLGVALTAIQTRLPVAAHAVPLAVGVLVLSAGVLQFTAWKAHHLSCCRARPAHKRDLAVNTSAAWQYGLRRGLHCCYCCAGPTAVLLGVGVMDLRAMALVMFAITAERLAPAGKRVARAIGTLAVAAGLILVARA
jgi:predicted metal-binding membrane protein